MARLLTLLWSLVIVLGLVAAPAHGQEVSVDKVTIGGTRDTPSGTSLRVQGLASSGSGQPLWSTSSGDVFRRSIVFGDLPGTLTRSNQAETITNLWSFNAGLTATTGSFSSTLGVTGLSTLTGGFSAGANSSVTGTFSVSGATTLSSSATVGTTLGVTGLSTLTGGFSSGANSSIAGNLTLTGTGGITAAGNVAVNGGTLSSTASNLNIDSASTISLLDDVIIGASKPIRTSHYASRTTGWGITYAGEADFRYTYADEFYTKNFIADLETAINGGQIIAKSTVVLATDFTCPAAGGTATLRVRDFPGHTNMRVFAASDWVVLRSMIRADSDADGNIEFSVGDCVGQVSSYADQTDDTQTWTFTRGSGGNAGSMASSTVVAADNLVIDFGVSGQGFLVARANDGTEGNQSPYWQAITWTTAPVAANMTVQTRWGRLDGSYGYSGGTTYGFAAGPSTGQHITVDPTNGFRVRSSTTTWAQMSSTGLTLGVTASGNGNIFADTSGNLFVRSGTVNRITATASNGNLDFLDDDGTTVRGRIGASTADFGSTTGARVSMDYANARLLIYDGTNNVRLFADGANGLVLGQGSNGSGKPYAQLTNTQLLFCEDGGGCTFQFDGATGNMSIAGNMELSGGGDLKSTGNFSLTATNGLSFAQSSSSSGDLARSVQWAGGSLIYEYNNGGSANLMATGSRVTSVALGTNVLRGGASGSSSTGIEASAGLLVAYAASPGTVFRPSTDGYVELGAYNYRFSNLHLNLAANNTPGYVLVNKGGGGSDANSALGYIVGYANGTSVTKTMGACSVTIAGGVITNVTGC